MLWFKSIFKLLLVFVISPLLLLALYVFIKMPSHEKIKSCFTTSMYEVYLCPKSPSYTPLRLISPYVPKAVLLSEDSGFYQHEGFEWKAIESSLKHDLAKKKLARGGSTITQQLAKNLFLSKSKTPWRKIAEAFIVVRIENVLSKKEILEKYLNVVQFGKNIFGVKQASHYYFKKSPLQLSILESAFLAFLLPSPEKYSQSYHRKELTSFAKKRMKRIVNDMYKYKRISQEEYDLAINNIDGFLNSHTAQIENKNDPENIGLKSTDDHSNTTLEDLEKEAEDLDDSI